MQPCGYDRPLPVADNIEVEFINAGHLLGSSYARVRTSTETILFGGDLGRFNRPVLPDPTMVDRADYLLVESTYGNRLHEDDDEGEKLGRVIRETTERGGRVVIPAFAIGRTEELLYWIRRLEMGGRIPVLPVYLDSPMATQALEHYRARLHELDPELRPEDRDELAPHGPSAHEPYVRRRAQAARERELCAFCTAKFKTVSSVQESKELTASKKPAIIISASGMATGGRVLHHLKAILPDPRNTALLVGFQAEGTRGRRLIDGEKTLRIHGIDIPVHAQVDRIDSMSAHADSNEILQWLRGFSEPPKRTFLVHGELTAMQTLDATIRKELGWNTHMPRWKEQIELTP